METAQMAEDAKVVLENCLRGFADSTAAHEWDTATRWLASAALLAIVAPGVLDEREDA